MPEDALANWLATPLIPMAGTLPVALGGCFAQGRPLIDGELETVLTKQAQAGINHIGVVESATISAISASAGSIPNAGR